MKSPQCVVCALALFAFAASRTLSDGPSVFREDLDALVAEYRLHGLPFPPDDAKLVMRERDDGTTNGVRNFHFELAFLIGPGKKPGTATYWLGCETVTLDSKRPDSDAEPAREIVAKTRSMELDYHWKGFTTFPDLALAIQCNNRGWHELANGLLERSRKPTGRPQGQGCSISVPCDRVTIGKR